MSKVRYFQRYSQRENVATNNTLLLLSRLYANSPNYLEVFLNDLVETGTIEIGPSFAQQITYGGSSIPDAVIEQKSFKLVVEAKRDTEARLDQLIEHLSAFGDEETKVLILLTPSEQPDSFKKDLRDAVRDFNLEEASKGREVVEICTTFEKIIHSFGGSLADHDHGMRELLEDYEEFCYSEKLLPRTGSWMRVVPCGKTIDDNRDLGLYYQPVTRSSRQHEFLGIYKDKRVQYIGRITKIVDADLIEDKLSSDVELTSEEADRIKDAIRRAENIEGYDIATGHRFYLVDEFFETAFPKVSPGGLRAQRYFDLVHELGLENERQLPALADTARVFNNKSWR